MNQHDVISAVEQNRASCRWVLLDERLEIMARPLRVDGRYVAASARTAEACAKALCGSEHVVMLPTTKALDALRAHGALTPEPLLIAPDRMAISSDQAIAESSRYLVEQLSGVPDDVLVYYGKSWVWDPQLQSHPGRAANYGMPSTAAPYLSSDGKYKLWQPLSFRHDRDYLDYSQLLQLVRRRR